MKSAIANFTQPPIYIIHQIMYGVFIEFFNAYDRQILIRVSSLQVSSDKDDTYSTLIKAA